MTLRIDRATQSPLVAIHRDSRALLRDDWQDDARGMFPVMKDPGVRDFHLGRGLVVLAGVQVSREGGEAAARDLYADPMTDREEIGRGGHRESRDAGRGGVRSPPERHRPTV